VAAEEVLFERHRRRQQQQNGLALEHASKDLQAELVKTNPMISTLAAWIQNPVELKDAPEEMKGNPGRGATVGGGNQPDR
jgi:hypothetical protein